MHSLRVIGTSLLLYWVYGKHEINCTMDYGDRLFIEISYKIDKLV